MRELSFSASSVLALFLILTLSKVSALGLIDSPDDAQGAIHEHHVNNGQVQARQTDAVTYPTPTGYGYPPPPPYGSEPTSSSVIMPYGRFFDLVQLFQTCTLTIDRYFFQQLFVVGKYWYGSIDDDDG
jgi:hypothetical protein